ncbi:MAG TPA: MFS transporter [Reyranella sp.]|nr:MFS transporter [Reyranella sp.]
MISREARVNLLISTGHFLSHFYQLCLPPLFLVWQRQFDISFAELGLTVVLMAGTAAVLQTPLGFLVDRYGARPFLIGGALLMSLSIAMMAFATTFWQILGLSLISGIGNAVFHPCDYAILAGSIRPERMGRSFALHSFTGNAGFAAAPPVVAALLSVMDWRDVLLVIGALGLPVVVAVIWQSQVLSDQGRKDTTERGMSVRELLLDRTLGLFFLFYFLGAMASGGVQAWLITVLHQVKGLDLAIASAALTAFMAGNGGGVLLGGWAADKSARYLAVFVAGLTSVSAVTILAVDLLPMGGSVTIGLMLASGIALGASRTPRDIMLKDAAPRGQIGKVFGFVSAGLPLGSAVTPVPFGFLIDHGRAELVLILAAGLLLASLLCMGSAKASAKRDAMAVPAE